MNTKQEQVKKLIKSLKQENYPSYNKSKQVIKYLFTITKNNESEDVFLRLTIIDKLYSTNISKNKGGMDALVQAFINTKFKKHDFIQYAQNQNNTEITALFEKQYGSKKAISLISKYIYFETDIEFPIYDSIVQDMFAKVWNYCDFIGDCPKKHRMFGDIVYYIDSINTLKNKLDDVSYDELDFFLWSLGKLKKGEDLANFHKDDISLMKRIIEA